MSDDSGTIEDRVLAALVFIPKTICGSADPDAMERTDMQIASTTSIFGVPSRLSIVTANVCLLAPWSNTLLQKRVFPNIRTPPSTVAGD